LEKIAWRITSGSRGKRQGISFRIITGNVTSEQAQAAVDAVNPQLPHYKQMRAFHVRSETVHHREWSAHCERAAPAGSHCADSAPLQIEDMYRVKVRCRNRRCRFRCWSLAVEKQREGTGRVKG